MSSDDNNSTANNSRYPIPIDTDNNPVSFHDNPAHIEGALEEFRLWNDRTPAALSALSDPTPHPARARVTRYSEPTGPRQGT